jgi:hypothetical protein
MAKKTSVIAEIEIPANVRKSRGIYAFNAAVRKLKRAYFAAKKDALAGDQTLVLTIAARD